MSARTTLLLWGGAALACALVGYALWQPVPPGPPSGPIPATEAADVVVHLDGEPVATLSAFDLLERRRLSALLPDSAREMSSWTALWARGPSLSRFRVETPGERLGDRDVYLYLGPDGHPAIGVFRRLHDGMSPAVRAELSAPGLFLHKVVDVQVWTGEEPRGVPAEQVGSLRVEVVGAPEPAMLSAADIAALPAPSAAGREGSDARHLFHIVALVAPAAQIEQVEVRGPGTPILLSRAVLRDPGVYALLRRNKRGLWVFDLHGYTAEGEPVTGRMRGVSSLVVTLGAAVDLPEVPAASPAHAAPARVNTASGPTPEEKKRIDALLELSRLAPDREARAQVLEGLEDESERVRLRAVRSLLFWEDCAEDLYAHIQREPSIEIQRTCVKAIGDKGEADFIERLGDFARGRSKEVVKQVDKARRRIAAREQLPEPERLRERGRR
jgi:hypothetical protein